MKISNILREWYKKNQRNLPWRETGDPYLVWLSEVILQQTRVNQGKDYYLRFSERFPSVEKLAAAGEDEVLKLWQGLGYYSRARNLHAAAKQVVSQFSGKFPTSYADLLTLKGVGPYTAAAVASISAGEPVAVVDGNVSRVISRLFLIEEPVNANPGEKTIASLAQELLDRNDPGTHNQAIMEFGALQCVPVNPDCSVCPLADDCEARAQGKVDRLPLKRRKSPVKNRYFTYFFIQHPDGTCLVKRGTDDIWKSLYEFPMTETESDPPESSCAQMFGELSGMTEKEYVITDISRPIRHQLTHRTIHARVIRIIAREVPPDKGRRWISVPMDRIGDYPVPRLIERYLEQTDL